MYRYINRIGVGVTFQGYIHHRRRLTILLDTGASMGIHTKNPVFEVGEQVRCKGNYGYAFTIGKVYTILTYEPCVQYAHGFIWPAYVRVLDDNGKQAACHAERFERI